MRSIRAAIALLPLLVATPALADDDFCVDRPGLNTPPCTLKAGEGMAEVGLTEWDHGADPASVIDTIAAGDVTLRYGLGGSTELGLGFTSYVRERVRDRASGLVSAASSTGDASLLLRHTFGGPGGKVALMGVVTMPVGKSPGGAGDWGAALLMPMAFDLPAGFELDATPEVDAAVNASVTGRHLAYGSAVGLAHGLAPGLGASLELGVTRDEDPAGAETQARIAASVGWQVDRNTQLDAEADFRLAGGIPDRALMVGFARRF